jgi:hypothetical protein
MKHPQPQANLDTTKSDYIQVADFINFQRKMYKTFANNLHTLTIDTAKNTVPETFSKIECYFN